MDSVENKSKMRLLIVAGIIVVFVIIAGAVYALVRANEAARDQKQAQNAQDTPARTVDRQVIEQDLAEVDASVKASKQAHEDAKNAINDHTKQIKVSQ